MGNLSPGDGKKARGSAASNPAEENHSESKTNAAGASHYNIVTDNFVPISL